jgi:hypothetical protein
MPYEFLLYDDFTLPMSLFNGLAYTHQFVENWLLKASENAYL